MYAYLLCLASASYVHIGKMFNYLLVQEYSSRVFYVLLICIEYFLGLKKGMHILCFPIHQCFRWTIRNMNGSPTCIAKKGECTCSLSKSAVAPLKLFTIDDMAINQVNIVNLQCWIQEWTLHHFKHHAKVCQGHASDFSCDCEIIII